MRILNFILVVMFLSISCNSERTDNKEFTLVSVKQDTFKNQLQKSGKPRIIAKDTTLTFSIDGLSAEGSEVKAHYINDTISNARWDIYGETGQSVIQYKFLTDGTVKVEEKNYTYKTNLAEVNSEKDMNLKSSLQYLLGRDGLLLSKINDKNFVNVFTDFKEHIPMILPNSLLSASASSK